MEDFRVNVNDSQCEKIARVLSGIRIRPGFYERDFLRISSDREAKLRMYFFAVAICHQTQRLHSADHNLYGWDYMEHVFLNVLQKYSAFINPGYLSIIGEKQVSEYLTWLFIPKNKPALCTLDDINERAILLIDTAKMLKEKYAGSVSKLVDGSRGQLLSKGKGIYELLDEFRAFSDPHRKKSSFFLKLSSDAGLLNISDPANMIPIMDYHMQRVLIRMGCVEINDSQLHQKLVNREEVATDEPIRSSCIVAMKKLVQHSGHPVWKMNDFLWALGRSCCHELVLCQEGKCEKTPCTFYRLAEIEIHNHCVFDQVCMGRKHIEYRNLWHPVVTTDFY